MAAAREHTLRHLLLAAELLDALDADTHPSGTLSLSPDLFPLLCFLSHSARAELAAAVRRRRSHRAPLASPTRQGAPPSTSTSSPSSHASGRASLHRPRPLLPPRSPEIHLAAPTALGLLRARRLHRCNCRKPLPRTPLSVVLFSRRSSYFTDDRSRRPPWPMRSSLLSTSARSSGTSVLLELPGIRPAA